MRRYRIVPERRGRSALSGAFGGLGARRRARDRLRRLTLGRARLGRCRDGREEQEDSEHSSCRRSRWRVAAEPGTRSAKEPPRRAVDEGCSRGSRAYFHPDCSLDLSNADVPVVRAILTRLEGPLSLLWPGYARSGVLRGDGMRDPPVATIAARPVAVLEALQPGLDSGHRIAENLMSEEHVATDEAAPANTGESSAEAAGGGTTRKILIWLAALVVGWVVLSTVVIWWQPGRFWQIGIAAALVALALLLPKGAFTKAVAVVGALAGMAAVFYLPSYLISSEFESHLMRRVRAHTRRRSRQDHHRSSRNRSHDSEGRMRWRRPQRSVRMNTSRLVARIHI